MSALDLFASAMGAFLLLSVISLPFFPNPPAKSSQSADAQKKIAQLQAQNDALQASLNQKNLGEIDKRPIELVISIDISGSMSVPLQRLKNAIAKLSREIPKVTPDFQIGVVAFGGAGSITTIPLTRINETSRQNFITEIDNLSIKPGSTDVPKAFNIAMDLFSANKTVRKAFVIIGDVGPYEMANGRDLSLYPSSDEEILRLMKNNTELTVNTDYEPNIYQRIEQFVAENKLSSVLSMYTGNATRPGDSAYPVIALTKTASTQFFKKVSHHSGKNKGNYSEEPGEMLSMLLLAIMVSD